VTPSCREPDAGPFLRRVTVSRDTYVDLDRSASF
jgi:hypothetical protein